MTNSYDVAHGLSQDEPGPLEPVEIAQQDDTLARTGNTARDQEMYAAGIRTGEENTKHNAAIRGCAAWLPIESAPKDGTEFQAWLNVGLWEPRCRFNPDSEAFEIWGRVDYDRDDWDACSHLTATHWMPLPAAPGVSTVEDQAKPNGQNVDQIVDEYIQEYELRGEDEEGRDGVYSPNETERYMIADAIYGLLAEPEFIAAIAGMRPATAAGDALDLTLAQKYEDACILANANARDAERYRQLRKALTSYDTGWLDRIAAALEAMGLDPDEDKLPTPEQVDGAFDAAQRKGDA